MLIKKYYICKCTDLETAELLIFTNGKLYQFSVQVVVRNSGKVCKCMSCLCVTVVSFYQYHVQLSLVEFVIAALVEREGELEERGDQVRCYLGN